MSQITLLFGLHYLRRARPLTIDRFSVVTRSIFKILHCDYMETGPALLVEVSPIRKRLDPTIRAGT